MGGGATVKSEPPQYLVTIYYLDERGDGGNNSEKVTTDCIEDYFGDLMRHGYKVTNFDTTHWYPPHRIIKVKYVAI